MIQEFDVVRALQPWDMLHLKEHLTDFEPYFRVSVVVVSVGRSVSSTVLANALQPAEAAGFLLSSFNVFWHQWMVKELQREFGSDTCFFFSLSLSLWIGSGVVITVDLKKTEWHPSTGRCGLFHILQHVVRVRTYELQPSAEETQNRDSGCHCFFRETAPWQVDTSLQQLTGSVCAPAAHQCQLKPNHCAAVSDGPTETRGQLVE